MTQKKNDNHNCKPPFWRGFSKCWSAQCSPFMGFILAAAVLWLDQASKWIILNQVMVPPHTVPVTSFLNIILAWNRGISFGLLSSDNPYSVWILATVAFAFSAILMLWIWRAETRVTTVALGLILGGAIGNLSDRLRFGAVTDFLDFHLYGYHWYTFNIADAAIVGGVALILVEQVKELYYAKKCHKKS